MEICVDCFIERMRKTLASELMTVDANFGEFGQAIASEIDTLARVANEKSPEKQQSMILDNHWAFWSDDPITTIGRCE